MYDVFKRTIFYLLSNESFVQIFKWEVCTITNNLLAFSIFIPNLICSDFNHSSNLFVFIGWYNFINFNHCTNLFKFIQFHQLQIYWPLQLHSHCNGSIIPECEYQTIQYLRYWGWWCFQNIFNTTCWQFTSTHFGILSYTFRHCKPFNTTCWQHISSSFTAQSIALLANGLYKFIGLYSCIPTVMAQLYQNANAQSKALSSPTHFRPFNTYGIGAHSIPTVLGLMVLSFYTFQYLRYWDSRVQIFGIQYYRIGSTHFGILV